MRPLSALRHERSRAKFSPRTPENTGRSKLSPRKSPRPSPPSALLSAVDPQNPRSCLEKADRNGTRTDHEAPAASAFPRRPTLRRTAVLAASASRRSAASGFPPASSFSAALSFAPHRRTSSIVPGSSLTTKHRITDFPKIGTPFGDLRFSGKQVDSPFSPKSAKPSFPSFSSESAKTTGSSFIGKSAGITQIGRCHRISQNHRFPALAPNRQKPPNRRFP